MSSYQETLRKYKESFFRGEIDATVQAFAGSGIPHSIIDAWRRTKKLGIPMELDELSPESKEKTVLSRLTGLAKQNWDCAKDEYYDIGRLLDAAGAVLYFLDDHLAIYNYIGSQELIDKLKTHGLKFSYSFAEKYLGVSTASLAQKGEGIFTMSGEEHPVDLFRGMFSMAMAIRKQRLSPLEDFDSSLLDSNYVVIVVLPLEKYNQAADKLLRVIIEKLILTCGRNANNRIYANMFVLTEETNKTPTIFLSPECKIVYMNKQCEQEFALSFSQCAGMPIADMIPELAFLGDTLKKQKKLKFLKTAINVRGASRNYYLETRFLRNPDGRVNSMRVSISTQGNVDYYLKNLNPEGNVAVYTFDSIIGSDEEFRAAKNMAMRAAGSSSNVLITGESGVGKELFAQAIHNDSDRRNGPFVAINCGSIPKDLLGSELFGYESGAFTGARKEGQIGKIELARGGTLFLDEITEMPLDMQSYLLRVIEERKLYRLGGNTPQSVNVRIIAATNRDVMEYIDEGKFRLDLYFRLNVIKISIPPLKNRRHDIAELAEYYVGRLSRQFNKNVTGIEREAMERMLDYSWPGNVRELRNAIEYGMNMSDGGELRVSDLPRDIMGDAVHIAAAAETGEEDLPAWSGDYRSYEQQQIRRMMLQYRGNKSRVARELGMSRNTLNKRLQAMHYGE